MRGFRFVHCADLHLGSRFKDFLPDDPGEAGRSSLESFSAIVDMALAEGASFMVISGDVFDRRNALPSTRLFFSKEAERAGIPIFVSKGNHDSERPWDRYIPFPRNVRVFGAEPETVKIRVNGIDVDVTGVSFASRYESRNLAAMLRGDPGTFTVACVHCDVEEADEGHPNAVCRLSDLMDKDVDYWALGHIHRRRVMSERPYVVYPGNIQGRGFKESGPKGAYLVSVSDDRVSRLTFVPTQRVQWKEVSVDSGSVDEDELAEILAEDSSPTDVVSLTVKGKGALADSAFHDAEGLKERLGRKAHVRIARVESRTDVSEGGMRSAGESLTEGGRDAIEATVLSHRVIRGHAHAVGSMTGKELKAAVRDAVEGLERAMEGRL